MARHVTKQVQQDPICQRLRPVPGVGPLVAGTSVATLEDPTRFRTSTQVAAYLGLVPRVYQSGAANYHGRISKEGGQAAALAVRRSGPCLADPDERELYAQTVGGK